MDSRSPPSSLICVMQVFGFFLYFRQHDNTKEVKDIEEEIAKETIKKIMSETKGMDSKGGVLNESNMWKLNNKITPKVSDVPTAMKCSDGRLIISKRDTQKRMC